MRLAVLGATRGGSQVVVWTLQTPIGRFINYYARLQATQGNSLSYRPMSGVLKFNLGGGPCCAYDRLDVGKYFDQQKKFGSGRAVCLD